MRRRDPEWLRRQMARLVRRIPKKKPPALAIRKQRGDQRGRLIQDGRFTPDSCRTGRCAATAKRTILGRSLTPIAARLPISGNQFRVWLPPAYFASLAMRAKIFVP
jgi:hypothetical protein